MSIPKIPVPEGTQRCYKCKQAKPFDCFAKTFKWCKECRREYDRKHRGFKRKKEDIARPVSSDPNQHWCSGCKAFLPVSSFSKSLPVYCRKCVNAKYNRFYHNKHPDATYRIYKVSPVEGFYYCTHCDTLVSKEECKRRGCRRCRECYNRMAREYAMRRRRAKGIHGKSSSSKH